MQPTPFARGGMRLAYRCQLQRLQSAEKSAAEAPPFCNFVGKQYKVCVPGEHDEEFKQTLAACLGLELGPGGDMPSAALSDVKVVRADPLTCAPPPPVTPSLHVFPPRLRAGCAHSPHGAGRALQGAHGDCERVGHLGAHRAGGARGGELR